MVLSLKKLGFHITFASNFPYLKSTLGSGRYNSPGQVVDAYFNFLYLILHRKKRSTVIKLFKKNNILFYPRLKNIFIRKSNGKSLSNCNSNCRGQTLCLNRLMVPSLYNMYLSGSWLAEYR